MTKLAVLFWIASCSAALAGTNAIVPGQSLGQLRLGEPASKAMAPLGKPASSDASMGRFWDVWKSHSKKSNYELDLLTIRDGSGLHTFVEQVRVTSPWFKTRRGIHVGSRFSAVMAAFPKAHLLNPETGLKYREVALYDDISQGIMFEFAAAKHGVPASAKCRAILVHPKRKSAMSEYSPFYGPDGKGVLHGQDSPFWETFVSMTHHR